jgi:hypothetical protein
MSYAAPFYYAAKAIQVPEPSPHARHFRARRRRIRLVLFPAQRPQPVPAKVVTAAPSDC